jgi:hypothetical protein
VGKKFNKKSWIFTSCNTLISMGIITGIAIAWPLFFVRVMLAGLRPTIIYILTPNFSSERMGVGVELWTADFARCTLVLAWSKYQAYI